MTIVALQTARAGSKSVPNKNIALVNGIPLYQYNLQSALNCNRIEHVFVSTDCHFILQNTSDEVNLIKRPKKLCEDNSSHHDVMIHGLRFIEDYLSTKVQYLVLLLGNSIIKDFKKIDEGIDFLDKNSNFDSVVTVSEFNMFNPFRAFNIVDGELQNFMNHYKKHNLINSNDKNAFGNFYYLNGEFQIMRRDSILSNGNPPFRWMGNKIYPLVIENNMEIDASWQLEILRKQHDRF